MGVSVLMLEKKLANWPSGGFSQLTASASLLPVTESHIRTYFQFRCATDKTPVNNTEAFDKGLVLLRSRRVADCRMLQSPGGYFTGFVRAAMKKRLSYNFKLRMCMPLGDVLNSQCEYPAGTGPDETCKHIAAVPYFQQPVNLLALCVLLRTFLDDLEHYIYVSCFSAFRLVTACVVSSTITSSGVARFTCS